jgi:hypothetical protein
LKTVSEGRRRHWDSGVSWGLRLTAAVSALLALLLGGLKRGWPPWVFGLVVGLAGLFLLPWTSVRISLRRDRRGRPQLVKQRFLCLVPLPPLVVSLDRYRAVLVDYTPGSGPRWMRWIPTDHEWALGLSRSYTPDRFSLELVGPGVRPVVLGNLSEPVMKELADALRDEAGLELKRK